MNKYILIVIILLIEEFFIFLKRKIDIIENSHMEKILKTKMSIMIHIFQRLNTLNLSCFIYFTFFWDLGDSLQSEWLYEYIKG